MKTSLVHVVVIVVLIAMAVLIPLRVLGQQQAAAPANQPPDLTIDAAARAEVLDGVIKELNDGYVFPDVAKKIEGDLRARQKNKEYDAITSARDFAKKLTDDVQSVSHDKHMRVRYSPEPMPIRSDRSEPTEAEKAEFSWYMKRT